MITREGAQVRKGFRKLIRSNQTSIIIFRKPLKDDGFDGEVEDPFGESAAFPVWCRLSHDAFKTAEMPEAPSGFASDIIRYISVYYTQDIVQGDEFEARSKRWKIGLIDPLYAYNILFGYQAPLYEAETVLQGGT